MSKCAAWGGQKATFRSQTQPFWLGSRHLYLMSYLFRINLIIHLETQMACLSLYLLREAGLSASDLFLPWPVVCLGSVVVLVTVL